MRHLIVSDIHANLAAFEAVLADAGEFDLIWCLGDLVGYGPDPNECVERLRELPHVSLAGNHDWAALGKLDLRFFNVEARMSCEWTQAVLNADNLAYLKTLPPISIKEDYTLAHGSPRQPIEEYILDPLSAEYNFSAFQTNVCLVGHTHWPTSYYQSNEDHTFCVQRPPRWNERTSLNNGRWIVNPGSVGQPRDGNPDAAYALLDVQTGEWEFRRVPYPVEQTQQKMRQHHMPNRLIERLAVGH